MGRVQHGQLVNRTGPLWSQPHNLDCAPCHEGNNCQWDAWCQQRARGPPDLQWGGRMPPMEPLRRPGWAQLLPLWPGLPPPPCPGLCASQGLPCPAANAPASAIPSGSPGLVDLRAARGVAGVPGGRPTPELVPADFGAPGRVPGNIYPRAEVSCGVRRGEERIWAESVGMLWPSLEATLMHHFSAWVLVTIQEVEVAVAAFRTRCHDNSSPLSRTPACALLRHVGTYQSLGLCDFDPCDSTSATCSSQDGLLRCTCRPGYLQVHPMDHTCAVCSSGFWLQDGTCSRCPFGFSGPGCQEPFLLALVAVSCVAGLVILLLFLLLVVFRLGRAQPSQEPHSPPQLPLHSPTLSLPRVRPPWTTMEAPVHHAGSRPAPLPQWWELDGGPRLAADTPSMKTFLGSPRRSPSATAPQPLGGTSNFVFVGDGEEGGKRSFF